MTSPFAEVAINLPPVRGTFHYHLPIELTGRTLPGHLVIVPFGPRRVQGIVVANPVEPAVQDTRPVEALVDPDPVLTPAQLELAHWLQREHSASLIDCLTLMLPPGLSQQADSLYRLSGEAATPQNSTEGRLLSLLALRGALRGRQIERALPRTSWRRAADHLVRRGGLSRESVLAQPGVRPRLARSVRLAVAPEGARSALPVGQGESQAAARRRRVVELLAAEGRAVEIAWVYAEARATAADVRSLVERGMVEIVERENWRDPLADLDFVPSDPPSLTRDQSLAWAEISARLAPSASGASTGILLHGVTGSGKTELYLRAVAEVLSHGKSAVVLVPEISLTPQTVRRFSERFPGLVGLMHSRLSPGERFDTWRRCRTGAIRVVVGPRSALFAPLADLGLIVVDEEHDESYKEATSPPRHHSRDTALAYARILDVLCLLGSATPDLVTSYRADRGEIHRVRLDRRILGHQQRLADQAGRLHLTRRYRPSEGQAEAIDLPPVEVVDMRVELRAGNRSLFSRSLTQALTQVLDSNQQAILFLNRRGTATHVFCRDCGWTATCARCENPLTFHRPADRLLCHHCGYTRKMPERCPQCGGVRVRQFGAGTQQVQAELEARFPAARALRWDRDTAAVEEASTLLAHFSAHRADVLIGTQMVAKGLDLPLVTLVGVVSADTGLNLPDYRAAERTFQVLTQVAGRAGRGLLGGRVILQTYQPEHFAIQAAARHDFEAFSVEELGHRRALGYPPYRRLARLVLQHTSSEGAEREAKRMGNVLRVRIARQDVPADLIGPVPCFYGRLRSFYRWQVVVRAADPRPFVPEPLPEGWSLDIDPVSLL
ncbi:MAG: primosomal protein N' [Anaerolineales bacterium]